MTITQKTTRKRKRQSRLAKEKLSSSSHLSRARHTKKRDQKLIWFFKGCRKKLSNVHSDILGILLIGVALFNLISQATNMTGLGGHIISAGFEIVFGRVCYLLDLILFVGGALLIAQLQKLRLKAISAYTLLFLTALCGVINQISSGKGFSQGIINLKDHGGALGVIADRPLNLAFSRFGAYFILFILCTLSLVGASNYNSKRLFTFLKTTFIDRPRPQNEEAGDKLTLDGANETFSSKEQDLSDVLKDGSLKKLGSDEENRAADVVEENVFSTADQIIDAKLSEEAKVRAAYKNWKCPPANLLIRSKTQSQDDSEVKRMGAALVKCLASHQVETKLTGAIVGPSVTRYELELHPGVKVAKVTSLSKDIAYSLAANDVRILAPVPGKSAVGVEVPNKKRQLVTLGDVFLTPEIRKSKHPLVLPFGKEISGKPAIFNLAEMPHLLIAGATGSGKSSLINSLLVSLLMKTTPDELRLVLIDPKRVELGLYSGIGHLLTDVVVDPKKASKVLNWIVKEMERRYELLASVGSKDITDFNDFVAQASSQEQDFELEELPYICVFVDELNDLMMAAPRECEDAICRIAQMARAVGIHLVLATQRPSVDVITGVIKANIPSRLAFSVSSLADSRVILDQGGAERLIGKGDMLLMTSTSSNVTRIQAPWVSKTEIALVVGFWRRQSSFVNTLEIDDLKGEVGGEEELEDELFERAMELVIEYQQGSTSMLQRKLKIGFARAGRLMDILERKGVVAPPEGSRARQVLITREEFEDFKARRQN